ncbi:ATP-binding protein [Roseobacter sp. CCS2]|uniref:ATP-binding protein n=1 Tax=Roseobacter sp. CCS2 TaxID=391593 RepID=UPI0002F414B2|nr:adenylate/guanylate cyclase domain-containing protein [Roseobacter sp. CCS2]
MSDPKSAKPTAPSGERKQITAVFMDIVGFSTIASTTDPEDLQDWLERFYAQARDVVTAHDGKVTEYLGDGIVALFGLDHADELAALKAVRAAMAALDRIDASPDSGITLQLRIGVATGEAAIRAVGEDGQGPRATGVVTTLAHRIQERAAPGTVMIAQSTQDLLRDRITTQDFTNENLRGFAETQTLFRPLTVQTAIPPAKSTFVGRAGVLQRIRDTDGPPLLIGPAGIGKTAVVKQLTAQAMTATYLAADGVNTHASYHPFIHWILRQTDRTLPDFADVSARFSALSDTAQQALALILGLPEGQRLLTERSNVALKTLIEESLWQALQAVQPHGLLVFEDLHWLDTASLGVLTHIIQSKQVRDYTLVMTSREDARIDAFFGGLPVNTIRLGPFSSNEATQLLNALSAGQIAPHQRAMVIDYAAGIPLFIEQLFQRDEAQPRHRRNVPGSLKDLLTEQIDNTGAAKPVLQCAAVIGQRFDTDMLRAIAADHGPLDPHLRMAQKQGVLRQIDDDTWGFAHALLLRAAYDSMLRPMRVDYHAQIAAHLQNNHADAVKRNPALLTEHLRLSQQYVPAIQNYLSVSQWAMFQGAFDDAEAHVLAAITLCEEAPDNVDVNALEVACYTGLGSIRMQTQGFTATPVKDAFDKVVQRAKGQNAYTAANGPAFYGGFTHAIISGDKYAADQFAGMLRDTAASDPQGNQTKELRLASLNVDTSLHFYTGRFDQASASFRALRDDYDIARHGTMISSYGADTYAAAQMFESATRAICGDAHLIPALVAETDAHQDRLNMPIMQSWAHIWGAVPLYYAGQIDAAISRVRRGINIADRQSAVFWQVTGAAWLNTMDVSETYDLNGLETFFAVIKSHETIGANVGLPYFRAHYAVALAKHDRVDDAYQASLQAIRENEASGLHCWYPEVLRLHARICAQRGGALGAARFRKKAGQIAHAQNALLWLLRVRLDQHQAKEIGDAALRAVLNRIDPAAKTPEAVSAHKRLAFA